MSALTEQLKTAKGFMDLIAGPAKGHFEDECMAAIDAALAEAVELEQERKTLLCSIVLIKDKARLPLTTKSEVIENLQELIAEQTLQESKDG